MSPELLALSSDFAPLEPPFLSVLSFLPFLPSLFPSFFLSSSAPFESSAFARNIRVKVFKITGQMCGVNNLGHAFINIAINFADSSRTDDSVERSSSAKSCKRCARKAGKQYPGFRGESLRPINSIARARTTTLSSFKATKSARRDLACDKYESIARQPITNALKTEARKFASKSATASCNKRSIIISRVACGFASEVPFNNIKTLR